MAPALSTAREEVAAAVAALHRAVQEVVVAREVPAVRAVGTSHAAFAGS